ncbi:MAG: MCE family protein [Alphaproteobacteria bacterium]|nr:MCE family protein [Alphaproteobacteria bacterium]
MNNDFTKEEKKAFYFGLFAIMSFGILFLPMAFKKQDYKHIDENFYHLNATFTRTDGLLVGDTVRMSGVDIGRVVNARLDENFHAVLKLEIKEGIQIPDDSSASIVSSSIMGRKYIEVDPGGSEEYLQDGAQFEQVQPAIVLQEVLNRLIASVGNKNKNNN